MSGQGLAMMSHPPQPTDERLLQNTTTTPTAESSTSTITLTEVVHPHPQNQVRLVLKKPKNSKKVNWTEGTVDNEGMNKRKSKCCCIYKKPHVFGESSSESEDECDNCFGHCELRKSDNPPPPPPPVPPVS